jgi:hypothetical protein
VQRLEIISMAAREMTAISVPPWPALPVQWRKRPWCAAEQFQTSAAPGKAGVTCIWSEGRPAVPLRYAF